MPLFDVTLIKVEVLFAESRFDGLHLQVGVTLENTLLLTIGHKQRHRNTRWGAGIAIQAMGAIEMIATAPKTHFG